MDLDLKKKIRSKVLMMSGLLVGLVFGKYVAKYFMEKPLVWDHEVTGMIIVLVLFTIAEVARVVKTYKQNEKS
jgi:F0F1-type ATP synthase assembly protein I